MTKKMVATCAKDFDRWSIDSLELSEVIDVLQTMSVKYGKEAKLDIDATLGAAVAVQVIYEREETDQEYEIRLQHEGNMKDLDKAYKLALLKQLKDELGE